MSAREDAFFFDCEGASMLGVLHLPARPATLGVLIVVGGPQYRVGSHRQFVLLSRALAQSGFASLRFDYRGMGDATGALAGFEAVEQDVRSAVDAFYRRLPGLQGVVLWGLCDGASAAACYAGGDPRIRSLVLANPWVRTEGGQARTLLKSYYRQRVFEAAFWRKMLLGKFDWRGSLASFGRSLVKSSTRAPSAATDLPTRMLKGLTRRGCPTLIILSGHDLVAAEFRTLAGDAPEWRRYLASPHVRIETREDADHTFSRAAWRDEVADLTRAWMLDLTRNLHP
jgi:exosortase A-associated hydrolase 1